VQHWFCQLFTAVAADEWYGVCCYCCIFRLIILSLPVHLRSLETWHCCHWELSLKVRRPKTVSQLCWFAYSL